MATKMRIHKIRIALHNDRRKFSRFRLSVGLISLQASFLYKLNVFMCVYLKDLFGYIQQLHSYLAKKFALKKEGKKEKRFDNIKYGNKCSINIFVL